MPIIERPTAVYAAPRVRSRTMRSGSRGCATRLSVGLGLAASVDDRQQGADDQCQTGYVEARPPARARVAEQHLRAAAGEDGDRDVDVQAPPPVEVLGEHPAQEQAHGAAARRDGAEDAECLGPLARIGEVDGEQGERGRREQCPEGTLQGARPEQHAEVDSGAAERRRAGEPGKADEERALAAGVVGDAAAEQQQAAERKRVRGDDPLARRVGGTEVELGGRQCDVHDRHVEHDHQLRQADEDQRGPATRVDLCLDVDGSVDEYRGVLHD
jgi:hypothetical protein